MEQNILSLGSEKFQKKILYHIFYSDFPKDIAQSLEPQHFTEEKHKIIFKVTKDYLNEFKVLPNIENIAETIWNNKTNTKEQRKAWVKELSSLKDLNLDIINGKEKNDFEFIKKNALKFIQAQELSNIATTDIKKIVETGNYQNLDMLTEKIRRIITIGESEDDPADIDEFDESIYTKRYRGYIPTGLAEIDKIIIGLPKGKMGMFVAAQGVGKSTILINTSVNAFKAGFKVLHIHFSENTKEDVQLLVSTALTGITLKEAQKNPTATHNLAKEIIAKTKTDKHAVLKIKGFNSSELTIPKLKDWIIKYQKKVGYTFDQINIDYVEEMVSHLRSQTDQWAGEKDVVSAFLSMLVELDCCGWTATQAKKESNGKKLLEISDTGGSVGKVKKAQVLIMIGRDIDDRNSNRATFHLAKSNISPSGFVFEDSVFDSSRMVFELTKPSTDNIIEEFNDDDIVEPDFQAEQKITVTEKLIDHFEKQVK